MDIKAEMTLQLSVYHYSYNNPINFNDPNGDFAPAKTASGRYFEEILNRLIAGLEFFHKSTDARFYDFDEES